VLERLLSPSVLTTTSRCRQYSSPETKNDPTALRRVALKLSLTSSLLSSKGYSVPTSNALCVKCSFLMVTSVQGSKSRSPCQVRILHNRKVRQKAAFVLWSRGVWSSSPSSGELVLATTRAVDLSCLSSFASQHPDCCLRKEVIQPQLPLQLPCYDFVPIIRPAFGSRVLPVPFPTSGVTNSHDVTGGVYKARERIHRLMLIHGY
jgi:hypothetical protein